MLLDFYIFKFSSVASVLGVVQKKPSTAFMFKKQKCSGKTYVICIYDFLITLRMNNVEGYTCDIKNCKKIERKQTI